MHPDTWWGIAALSFGLGFSGAMAPGPLLSVTIERSARHGAWTGPLIVLGHGLLEGILVVLLFAGLSRLLGRPAVMGVIGVVGGLALLWMGVGMLRSGRVDLAKAAAERHPLSRRQAAALVGLGAVVSVSNPYWTGWWATIGLPQMGTAMALGGAGVIAFFLGHITSDLAWYSVVSAAVGRGRGVLGPRPYQAVLWACGAFLLWQGASFLYTGLHQVTRW